MDHEISVDESVSMAVVRAVSAVENRDPVTLPPLSAVLDPDALDALFDSTYDGKQRIGGQVSFVFSECRITVEHGEYLTAEPLSPLEPRVVGADSNQSGTSETSGS
jgi:hypothetical protein